MGRVQFTNADSDGNPVTERLALELDGERHVIDVASTGSAMIPAALEEYLVESDAYQVEPYNSK